MSKRKILFVLLGLVPVVYLGSISPFWLNQCSHQLSEAEKVYLMQKYSANIQEYEEMLIKNGQHDENERKASVEKYTEKLDIEGYQERLEKTYIPCGSSELSLEEKMEAARRRLGVLDLLYDEPGAFPLPVRLDLEYVRRGARNDVQSYHFVGYTVFYIPVFRAWGGGSGYYEICGLSSKCGSR